MAKMIIANPQGQLLINSLDVNNDSPIQLAAYRKQMTIYMMLAYNNAFLDQPNAAGEDAIDAIQDPAEKERVLHELERAQLTEGNMNRIQTELRKMKDRAQMADDGGDEKDGENQDGTKTPMSPKSLRKVSFITSNNEGGGRTAEKEKPEGYHIFEKVMKNQDDFINSSHNPAFADIGGSTAATRSPARTGISQRPISSPTLNKSYNDEFEVSNPCSEFTPSDEIVVVSLMPAPAFFYIPKTTTYDNLPRTM